MTVNEKDCLDRMDKLTKIVTMSTDMEILKSFNNDFQVKAYQRLKRSQEISQVIKLIFKLVSEISVITGAIAVVLELFL